MTLVKNIKQPTTLELVFPLWYYVKMNAFNDLEPGILKNFRLFIGVRLALVISSLLYLIVLTRFHLAVNLKYLVVIVLIDAGFLFVYLSLPKLTGVLKKLYLPIAIIWATLGPMVQVYLGFQFTKTDTVQITTYFMTSLPFLVMFIPLVIVAWQYGHKYVLLFCGVTLLVDFIFSLQILKTSTSAFMTIVTIALIRTTLFLLIGNMISNLMKIQREQRQQLIEANENLVNYASTMEQLTISRERNRMARELHDLMAHTMSGVAVELEGASSMLSVDPEKTEKLLEHSLSAVRSGLMETRRALLALRSSQLEDLGLSLAIKNLVDTLPSKAEYQIDLEIDNIRVILPANVEQCFYRVAQEALSNIVSHAKATMLSVHLKRQEELLILSVKDNGVGFDENIEGSDKYGLLGMKERAEMIQANLSIKSTPGIGTQIELKYRGIK